MTIKLFVELIVGSIFHFYDKPDKPMVKSDPSHAIGETGRRRMSPTVGIFEDRPDAVKSIYDQTKGDSDDHS